MIPTEPIGSIPRPPALAIVAGAPLQAPAAPILEGGR
jgi:hypothetical protein